MSVPTPTHQLAHVPLFAALPTDLLDELAQAGRVRQYPAGQILCIEGDLGDHLIVLESGQLRISRVTPMGDEVVLAVVEAPVAVGELALLDGAPRDATVTAQRAVTVRLVPRSVFLALLKREPLAIEGLLRTLAGLVRAGNTRHADVLGLDVPGRLAKWLLNHAPTGQGGTVSNEAVVVLHCTQGELAAELGTTRSTLNRALHQFEGIRVLSVNGERVTLHKPGALREYTM